MGRKSLLTSTEKRKSAVKKKGVSANSAKALASKKTAVKAPAGVTQKTAAIAKATPAAEIRKKVAAAAAKAKIVAKAPAKPKAQAEAPTKIGAQKVAAAKKPEVTIKELLLRKFGTGAPRPPVVDRPEAGKAAVKLPEAPPFVSGHDKKETERIRALLFKGFDLKAPPRVEKTKKKVAAKAASKPKEKTKGEPKKAVAAEKPKLKLIDLLLKRFDAGLPVQPVVGYRPASTAPAKPSEEPPFVSGYDEKETNRVRALLFKGFDLKAKPPGVKIKEAPRDGAGAKRLSPPEDLPKHVPASPVASAKGEPTEWLMKACLWGLGILLAIVVVASFSNRSKFYLENVDGTAQVWRGRFSPVGKELVLGLDGIKTSLPEWGVYTKAEIFPILFGYLQDKADSALNHSRGPDLGAMKGYLRQAVPYAPRGEARRKVELQLKSTDFIVLLHKADLALSKGTPADLKAAKEYLDEAGSYATRDYQRELVSKTKGVVDSEIAALRAR